MSKLPTVVRPPQRFDLQKFETMNEPFAVRIEKHKGNMKYEITPPPPDEAGWTKERVRALDMWIVTEWSGGGHYAFAITDSSSPPQTMEWVSYYPPDQYPEKTPPTLQGAVATMNPPPPQVAQVRSNMASPVLPPASFFQTAPTPQPVPQATPMNYPAPSYYPPQAYAPQGFQQPAFYQPPQAPAAAQESAELRAMREQLAQAREQAAQYANERRMAEVKAESDKRFTELQQLIQAMGQQMLASQQSQQNQRPVIDPAVEELKAQNRMMQEQMRMQVEQQARDRREQELRDQIKHGQEETRRLVEAANLRAEQMMREAGSKGPDPQFMMMMQTMKEIASSSQTQFDRLQNMMMRPAEILAMAKDSSSSTDNAVANMARQYESIFGLQRQLTEQAAQLNQGGGNEVIGLVRDIGDKVGEWAGRYSTGKSREAVASVQAQAEIAKANSAAIQATQERMAELARLEAGLKSGAVIQMPDGSFRAGPGHEPAAITAGAPARNGANGHANGANGHSAKPWLPPKAPRTASDSTATTSPPANGNGLSGVVVDIEPPKQPKNANRKIKGRSDDEWFGPMKTDVLQLRDAVDKFIAGVNETPPRKPEGSASPEECAFAINQAATEIMRLQVPIPAITDLLVEGMVADFLDVLLPDAPQQYRDDVVQILMAPDDEDEDEDEDDEGEDETGEHAQA